LTVDVYWASLVRYQGTTNPLNLHVEVLRMGVLALIVLILLMVLTLSMVSGILIIADVIDGPRGI
jgi:hypothetical protein